MNHGSQLKTFVKNYKQNFDATLERFLAQKEREYTKVDTALGEMLALAKDQILRGGKRLRPLLCRLTYQLAGGDQLEKIIKVEQAIELIHSFILIHDDIADRDEQRRGKPTLHLTYQKLLKDKFSADQPHHAQALAMVAGDLLYGLARECIYLSGFGTKEIVKADLWISQYLSKTVAGWTMQFYQLNQKLDKVKESEYLKATSLVNSHYTVEGPIRLGLIFAQNHRYQDALSKYALAVGTAFQIRDDVLGMFGDQETTGKPVGNDFREGKKTSLVLRAMAKASIEDKRFLTKHLGRPIRKSQLERVQKIIKNSGVVEEVTALANKRVDQGLKALAAIDSPRKDVLLLLKEIARFVVKRVN